jgi:Cu-Zn family superoxide dismutase
MKISTEAAVKHLAGVMLILGTLSGPPSSEPGDRELNAEAIIAGGPGSAISGVAKFSQTSGGILPTVRVTVLVKGLEPNSVHGVHIHENGSCADTNVPFGGAGGHFDPGDYGNSNPDTNHPFHMGDLPNLTANKDGEAFFEHRTSRITLSPGPLSLFDENGSAVIIHLNRDQGIPGAADSGISGGPRIGCGTIKRTN